MTRCDECGTHVEVDAVITTLDGGVKRELCSACAPCSGCAALAAVTAHRDRLEVALPDPAKLWALADWIDAQYPGDVDPEVQRDLRGWARGIMALRLPAHEGIRVPSVCDAAHAADPDARGAALLAAAEGMSRALLSCRFPAGDTPEEVDARAKAAIDAWARALAGGAEGDGGGDGLDRRCGAVPPGVGVSRGAPVGVARDHRRVAGALTPDRGMVGAEWAGEA